MDILRTFEIFWSLPKRLFRKKSIKVVHIETETSSNTPQDVIQTYNTGNELQLSVYNSPQVYSLLRTFMYKKRLADENKNGEIYQKRTFY